MRLVGILQRFRQRVAMRAPVHPVRWVPLVALAAALLSLWEVPPGSAEPLGQDDEPPARRITAVTMFDNDAPSPMAEFDPEQAFWGFGPDVILARQRDRIVFYNPSSNKHPHTVTSLERVGSPFNNQVSVGTQFDSSPNAGAVVQPGQSFTLDTSPLAPGNYPYFCKLHPWMVGEITVTDRRLR